MSNYNHNNNNSNNQQQSHNNNNNSTNNLSVESSCSDHLVSFDDLFGFNDEEDDPSGGNQSDSGKSTQSQTSSSSTVSRHTNSSNLSGRKRIAADFDSDCSSLSDSDGDDDEEELYNRPTKRFAFRPHAADKAPIEPASMETTKFTCDMNLIDIESLLRSFFCLKQYLVEERFHAFLLYQTRSKSCSFRVNIYTPLAFIELDSGIEQHIIEVVYEDGDKYQFYEIFAEIKHILLSKKEMIQDAIHEIVKDITIATPRDLPPVC